MKKKITIIITILILLITFSGCKKKVGEDVKIEAESTLIETNKKVSDFGEDYKSVLYAYLNNYYNKIKSFKYDVDGKINAKVLFINYNIDFSATTIKQNDATYTVEHSHSSVVNIDTIRYQTRTKTIETTDSKKYKVYDTEEFEKVSYSDFTPLLLGYVCNDDTILSAKLVESSNDTYTIRYVFDTESATPYIKRAVKYSGNLKELPTYNSVVMEVTMKNDFTPVKVVGDYSYNATKPIIGSGLVNHHSVITYSQINEEFQIENESKFIELCGQESNPINVDEESPANELLEIIKTIPIEKGVSINGNISSGILSSIGADVSLRINLNLKTNLESIKEDYIYNFANFYGEVETDDNAAALFGLISSFAGEALGEYADLLTSLHLLKAYYLGDGKIYLQASDSDDLIYYLNGIKLTDIADAILNKVNLSDITSLFNDEGITMPVSLEKETISDSSLKYKAVINDEFLEKVKSAIDTLLAEQPMIQSVLAYKEFGEVAFDIVLVNNAISKVEGHLNYINESDETIDLIAFELEFVEANHDYDQDDVILDILNSYLLGKEVASQMEMLIDDFHLDYKYKAKALELISQYDELDEIAKSIVGYNITNLRNKLEHFDEDVQNAYLIGSMLMDIENLDNDMIYKLCKAYNNVSSTLELRKSIGNELMQKYDYISEYVDFFDIENDFANIDVEADISSWGLSDEQIKNYQSLFRIAQENYDVQTSTRICLGINGILYYDNIANKVLGYQINN